MLARIVLVLLQLAAAWYAAPYILKYIPAAGPTVLFAQGAIFAVVAFLVGLIGAEVLKDIPRPGSGTLAAALIGGLVGAAIATFGWSYVQSMGLAIGDKAYLPLAGAVLGYAFRR